MMAFRAQKAATAEAKAEEETLRAKATAERDEALRANKDAITEKQNAVAARKEAEQERNRALIALFKDLSLDDGAANEAGSICFKADSGCVCGHEIPGVTGPPGTPIKVGTLDAHTRAKFGRAESRK
jgi:membrane protein involved in colicin uptake